MNAGIWLDHTRALVVHLDGDDEHVAEFESGLEPHHRATHGAAAPTKYGAQYDVEEQRLNERRAQELRAFYRRLAEAVKDAGRIALFGPGEAKNELKNELEADKSVPGRVWHVESTDKMTDKKIRLHIKAAYGKKPPRKTEWGA